MTKPILCVDFDGCLGSYMSGWKGASVIPDPPVPGAIAWLYKAMNHFQIVIYSSRSKDPDAIKAMADWLKRYGARDALLAAITFAHEKPAAFLTIDDRAICFDGDWNSLDPVVLLGFKPWHARKSLASAAGARTEAHAEHPRSDRT